MSLWGVRLAFCAISLAVLAIAAFRFEVLEFRIPLLAVATAVLMALVATLFLAIGLFNDVAAKSSSVSGVLRGTAILCALALAVPGVMALRSGMSSPPIHDITTNPDDPPLYEFVMTDRRASDNSLDLDAAVIAQQRTAYPQLTSITLAVPLAEAYGQIREHVLAQGWHIVGERTPLASETLAPDRDTARAGDDMTASTEAQIEAVAQTRIFGFRDDVAIRLRNTDAGTQIDMRSASRVGLSDLGANAQRISAFLAGLSAL